MPDDDPISDGHNAAIQAVTVGATLAGELARRGAARTRDRADDAARDHAAIRAQEAAGQARAAARWAPILDRDYRSHATTGEALDAWFAAATHPTGSPQAARATALAETRLRVTAPTMMADYDAERRMGATRADAMQRAVPLLDVPTGSHDRRLDDLAGALTRRGRDADATAGRLRATPDDPSTPRIDEHLVAVAAATGPASTGVADRAGAARARVRAEASSEFPVVITSVPLRITQPAGSTPGAPHPSARPRARAPRR